MTGFEVVKESFDAATPHRLRQRDPRLSDWPVVYTLDDDGPSGRRLLYVGQTNSAGSRMEQHYKVRPHMHTAHVLVHDQFNRSAALDLEAWLIARFQGDPAVQVENAVQGQTRNAYFDRERYDAMFPDAFDALLDAGLFTLDLASIENTEFFKLSPFKSLTRQQEDVVRSVLDEYFEARRTWVESRRDAQLWRIENRDEETGASVLIEGGPGTGKTIVAITILKQLMDV
ncbi:MAG: hypothetical protein QM607_02700 [Microbacterium sp.]